MDVVLLQETHTENDSDFASRGKIAGYSAIGVLHLKHYGLATFVRSDISNASLLSEESNNDVHSVTITVADLVVVNIYKPPNSLWPNPSLPVHPHPAVYSGDFNSHHTSWRYAENDQNGMKLTEWADANHLHLVFDAKDKHTFWSARWRRGFNPDLCFVTSDNNRRPLQTDGFFKTFPIVNIDLFSWKSALKFP